MISHHLISVAQMSEALLSVAEMSYYLVLSLGFRVPSLFNYIYLSSSPSLCILSAEKDCSQQSKYTDLLFLEISISPIVIYEYVVDMVDCML